MRLFADRYLSKAASLSLPGIDEPRGCRSLLSTPGWVHRADLPGSGQAAPSW